MTNTHLHRRFIAFVDILGFSTLVDRMSKENDLFKTIRDALKSIDRQSRDFQHYRRKQRDKRKAILRKGTVPLSPDTDLQMTGFSDCYVLSEVSLAWHVLAAVQALGSRFLAEGILIRGAVVQGDAYHRDRVLFGPGIIEAHKLESEVAKYPRILVSDQVREAVWNYHLGRWKGNLLECDVDGCWFVNLLVPSLSSWAPLSDPRADTDSKAHLRKVRRSLIDLRRRARGNSGHLSKIGWLIHKFNQAADKARVDPILNHGNV